jgi:carotenoid phi-ring synthase / carotenoid chi-ring synthase
MIRFEAQRVTQPSVGGRERVPEPVRAVVVGGGLAGIAAATVLAERGVSATVLERNGYLGGRAGAWTERLPDGEPFEMERGFHAFFRQYYNLRNLLRRVDPGSHNLIPLLDYPLLGPHGARESFTGLPRLPPFNVIELVRRTPRLRLPDLVRVNVRAALEMLAYDPEATWRELDDGNARDYLDSLNFPNDARQMLFNVFSHSFFNPEEGMSAADMLMMFHFYFMGNPEGLVFDVLNEPFSWSVWQPLRRRLEQLGATFRLDAAARRIERAGTGWRVLLGDASPPATGELLVLATEVPALKSLVADSPDLADPAWRGQVAGLDVTLPFAVWRVFLDRPVRPGRHPFVGTTGLGFVDNVSVYELFEGESRRWAMRTGGSVIEVHAYGVAESATEAEIRADFASQLHELYPETREAKHVHELFLLRRDCASFAPGTHRNRATVETPWPGLALAGDFVRLPFPSALMERATASGFLAANHLLSRWDVQPQEVLSVPRRGLLADFRPLWR